MKNKIKNFYKRWNIEYDEKTQFVEFKNRFLISFDLILGNEFFTNQELVNEYLRLIGIKPLQTSTYKTIGGFLNLQQFTAFGQTIRLSDSHIWYLLNNIEDFSTLIKCIQAIDWLDGLNENKKRKFFEAIKKDITFLELKVRVKVEKSNILLYPSGSKLLDEKLINDILDWLDEYPRVKKEFKSALEGYANKSETRLIIDSLRLSFELFLRDILKNNKSLEKQNSSLGGYLNSKGTPKEISNSYIKLIDMYTKYNDEYVKHNNEAKDSEIELIIYLTGCFIRYILKLEGK